MVISSWLYGAYHIFSSFHVANDTCQIALLTYLSLSRSLPQGVILSSSIVSY